VFSSVILVLGIGGAIVKLPFNIQIQGMALAAIIGVLLNLILPGKQPVEENMFEETESVKNKKTA